MNHDPGEGLELVFWFFGFIVAYFVLVSFLNGAF